MADQIPGANVMTVLMQAPTDIMGLATRQVTETVDTFGAGIQRLSAELAVPPEIKSMPGLPPLPGVTPADFSPAPKYAPPAEKAYVPRKPQIPRIIV